jgi:hypothetical protein
MHQSKNNHLLKVKKSNGIGYYPTLDYVMNAAPSIGNLLCIMECGKLNRANCHYV